METRKITVISTAAQSTTEIMTSATTLGEFREDLSRMGIESTGMTFLEGRSRTELFNDSDVLPTNVPDRNGNPTNELVFLMTVAQKKIASGLSREECYKAIHDGGFAARIKNVYGFPYTNLSTATLEQFLSYETGTVTPEKGEAKSRPNFDHFIDWLYDEDDYSKREKEFVASVVDAYIADLEKPKSSVEDKEDLMSLFTGLI